MKLRAVYDQSGRITAAVQVDFSDLPPGYVKPPLPQAGDGEQVAEIDVPDEECRSGLYHLCTRMKVDTRANPPALVMADKGTSG